MGVIMANTQLWLVVSTYTYSSEKYENVTVGIIYYSQLNGKIKMTWGLLWLMYVDLHS